ncbi:MAG TPA: HAMP domain-containing sensor histidine kinase [Gemmatimonadaceae bacterium]|nr:HAMP domain-containing sensor histidine kinase [Gemmatimonadaceae bacterium]
MILRRSAPQRSRPSIRRVAIAAAVVFGLLELAVLVGQMWTSSLLRRATETAAEHTREMTLAGEAELTLLMHQRLSHLFVLTGEAELETARSELASRLRSLLREVQAGVDDQQERSLIARAMLGIGTYLDESGRTHLPGAELDAVVQQTRPVVNEALASLELVRDLNAMQVRQAHARALRLDRLSNVTGAAAVALFAVALGAVIWGLHRYLLDPMVSLHRAVVAFRTGDGNLRAPEVGGRESVELAQSFNEMVDALARERESRLAFLAGVAHDLRNPLNGLKVGLQAMEAAATGPEQRRTLAMLDRQADHLARMVSDLLDATRIEAGKLEMHLERVDLCHVVQDIVHLHAPTAPRHELVADLPEGAVAVRGDRVRLEQVLTNLVTNAIKFSPAGGRIEVTVRVDGAHAVLAVHDPGIGIPPGDVGDLFQPFRRHRPEIASGAGIGLSVVRRIVTAHGGTIAVESTPGRGSTFRVRLPCEREWTYDTGRSVRQPSTDQAPASQP